MGEMTMMKTPDARSARFASAPAAVLALPIDHRGFPIPWFVAVQEDGSRDFRVADGAKMMKAVRKDLCWMCGTKNNPLKTFVIGPMCAVNLTSSEPPCHPACARFAAVACPFLSKPKMRRREGGLPQDAGYAGVMIERNPGVTMLWTTRRFKTIPTPDGPLFNIGKPVRIEWFAEGRTATREEVAASVASGAPILRDLAEREGPDALLALAARIRAVVALLPEAA